MDAHASLVIAWGGDGTINGAASALAGTGIPLGIVPAGSGNGLARDLGLPLDPAAALAVAATGATRTIDGGDLDGSAFFNVAGIGLDARIAERMAAPGARRGLAGYAIATLGVLPSYRPRRYTIDIGRTEPSGPAIETLHVDAYFIALANSRQYGNGAQIAPQARLDDGEFDLVVVQAQPLARLMMHLPAFFNGALTARPGILMRRATTVTVTADHDIPFHVDGEPRAGGRHLVICARPGALLVKVSR